MIIDVNKTSRYHSVEKLYAEVAKKTAAAIGAERQFILLKRMHVINGKQVKQSHVLINQ
jgi:hypothetical protein